MRILLSGATGQMGRTVTEVVAGRSGVEITGGVAEKEVQGGLFPIHRKFSDCELADVIIDFSSPMVLTGLLEYATNRKLPVVLAATGYSEAQEEEIREAAKEIAILKSGNLSMGVNILQKVAKELAHLLDGFDIEIVEKHHKLKKDSPSGTAKMLFDSVNEGRGGDLTSLQGRGGFYDKREETEVGVSSIRGGTVVGEHSVLFYGLDEVIEITHIAHSKKIFANGALQAAKFLLNRPAGLYNMTDVLSEEEGV
ncbi:MAG: 4-hydroxy-tetrahydrodipicolinate reductase [Tissierellia bacterium]|nr:4-hydroxy-tetrahydrodipicolinate reductase [Tissierellia bacterium]